MSNWSFNLRLWWLRLGEVFYGFRLKNLIVIVLTVAVIGAITMFVRFLAANPARSLEPVYGVTETAFLHQTRFAHLMQVNVLLDNGSRVTVGLPHVVNYRPGGRVKLNAVTRGEPPNAIYVYTFAGYVDDAGKPLP